MLWKEPVLEVPRNAGVFFFFFHSSSFERRISLAVGCLGFLEKFAFSNQGWQTLVALLSRVELLFLGCHGSKCRFSDLRSPRLWFESTG